MGGDALTLLHGSFLPSRRRLPDSISSSGPLNSNCTEDTVIADSMWFTIAKLNVYEEISVQDRSESKHFQLVYSSTCKRTLWFILVRSCIPSNDCHISTNLQLYERDFRLSPSTEDSCSNDNHSNQSSSLLISDQWRIASYTPSLYQ